MNEDNNFNGYDNNQIENGFDENMNISDNNYIDVGIGDDNGGPKKSKKILIIIICIILLLGIGIAAVALSQKDKGKDDNKSTEAPIESKVPEPVTETAVAEVTGEPSHDGMVQSRLTGEWISPELAAKRPYAVMISNIKAASPQSGISEAEILFECVVEGGITRCMGIFDDVTTDRLGSLRSARPYYVSFAKDFDALYIHVGGSDDAKTKISELGIADLDANGAIGNTLMYRDSSIKAPHNAFTSSEKIDKAVVSKKFRTDYQGKENNYFGFSEATIIPEGTDAGKVSIKFSSYTTPYFTYNVTDGMYYRYQFGSEHVDKNTGEQLKFKNIILMYVKQWSYDEADRQDMDIYNSSGTGKYISNGKAIDITWKRNEANSTMQFLDATGNLLTVNTGKTYIGVVPNTMQSSTSITAQ